MLLLSSADFFQNKLFQNILSETNGLNPDQDSPDLDPNCLHRLSGDYKS